MSIRFVRKIHFLQYSVIWRKNIEFPNAWVLFGGLFCTCVSDEGPLRVFIDKGCLTWMRAFPLPVKKQNKDLMTADKPCYLSSRLFSFVFKKKIGTYRQVWFICGTHIFYERIRNIYLYYKINNISSRMIYFKQLKQIINHLCKRRVLTKLYCF